jgi:putative mRNA 3-end processing factor
MKIKILGSGQEVGRSAILLEDKKNVMLDYGVKIEPSPPKYPHHEKAHAAIMSHAHLDHIGALPLLCKKSKTHIFMNDVTLELGAMLIKDSIKVGRIEGYGTPFSEKDLKKTIKMTNIVGYHEKFRIGEYKFSLWPSGHIPGSSSILAEGDKKIFYTSDIQTTDSHLLKRCQLPQNVDTLIIESTYGMKNHQPRTQLEKTLIETVEEALAKDEIALIPVFAIGRAQEIIMILEKYSSRIALDGMAKLASEIIEEYSYYLNDAKKFKNILKKVNFVRTHDDRKKAISRHSILVSSAGMLGGGPAVSYLRDIKERKESKVIFCGFLIEDTPGRNLIQTKIFKNAEEEFNVHCDLHQLELSAHTDRRGLFEIIKRTNPKQVICVHGDSCKQFAKDVEEHFGVQAFAPKNDEVVKI